MYQSLPGFRDFSPADYRQRNHIFRILRATAAVYGFEEFDGPVLEPLELYVDKSGEEVVDQLFWFEDRGGRKVALRPEMTPTLARMAGASANSLRKPTRWFTLNEQYRFERPQKGRQRSFYQFNLDILGEKSAAADAEVIACLIAALEGCGLGAGDFKVRLSDRRLWSLFLDRMGIGHERHTVFLSLIDKAERMSREKLLDALRPHFGDGAEDFIARVDELRGLRTTAELEAFFQSISTQAGQGDDSRLLLQECEGLRKELEGMGVGEYCVVDLGIVRGLAYYTGPVFEIFEADGKGRALAGGGRYDGLIEKVSGNSLEAVGGALGDVTLLDLLEKKNLLPDPAASPECYVLLGGGKARAYGLRIAQTLRRAGISTLYPLKETGFGKQFKEANRLGARLAVIAGESEMQNHTVRVKDFETSEENEYPLDQLVDAVR